MAVEINDVARVVINGRIHGQNTKNVMHFKAKAAGPTLLSLLIAAVVECIVQSLLPRVSSEWQFEGVKATMLSGDFDELEDATQSANGSIATDALPSFCAGVIRFTTARRGRSGRGRMYLAGGAEVSQDDSTWDSLQTTFQDFLVCLLTKFVGFQGDVPTDNNWKLVILSRKELASQNGDYNAATFDVVGGSFNDQVCTMRSRKIGHGT